MPGNSGVRVLLRILFSASHRIPFPDEFADVACPRCVDGPQVPGPISVFGVLTDCDIDSVVVKHGGTEYGISRLATAQTCLAAGRITVKLPDKFAPTRVARIAQRLEGI